MPNITLTAVGLTGKMYEGRMIKVLRSIHIDICMYKYVNMTLYIKSEW